MAIPVEQLANAIGKYRNLFVGKEGVNSYRDLVINTSTVLIEETTPVETGIARNNWFLQVGHLNLEEKNELPSGADFLNKSRAQQIRDVKTSVYLTNNLEYIEPLENNHSAQTLGQGILKPTVEKAISWIKKNYLKKFK